MTTISPANAQKVWVFAQNPDGTLSPATIGGGGGSGTVTNIATTSPITGGPITTTGTIACPTCTTNAAALTANALVIGGGAQATSALGSLGTTTTVLHGNAAGAPTFGAVNLATDVSGQLPISAVGSAGLSGTSPITISAAGAIACPTCNTSAAAITSNVLAKGSGGAQGLANSSITDNGTTVSTTEPFVISAAGAASQSAHLMTGALFTGGSGTTTFPFFYISQGASPRTTLSTSGTIIGINAVSGFAGNFLDFGINAANSVFTVSSTGNVVSAAAIAAGTSSTIGFFGRSSTSSSADGLILLRNNAGNGFTRLQFGGTTSSFPALQGSGANLQAELADGSAQTQFSASKFNTETNCANAASPAVCGSASSGSVVIASAATTVQVNSTAVAANSIIIVVEDSSLGTKLGVTCNTTIARTYAVTARTAATNFTITTSAAPVTNPACLSYWVIN